MAQRGQPGGKREGATPDDPHGKPQTKRRRLDKPVPEESGDWDDLEFTQQDLENLDVVTSQAMGGGVAEAEEKASTSRQGAEVEHRNMEQTLDLESASFSVAEPDQSGFQAPAPGATLRLKNRLSTSSNSDSSVYPQSSASLRKTPSSDMSSAAGSLTRSSSSGEPRTEAESRTPLSGPSAQNGAAGGIVTITALREDLRKKDLEAQKAQSEVYAKEGEVKFLKEALHKQEQELERLRAEREERKDAEEKRQKEREKDLKQEVERLHAQVQFKAQDILQLQQRYQTMESRMAHQQGSSPSKPQPSGSAAGASLSASLAQSPDGSPRLRRVEVRGSRTPEKGTFPSLQSFLSPRPAVTGGAAHSVAAMTTAEGEGASQSAGQQPLDHRRERRRFRRLRLARWCSRGGTPGPQLVSQLLHCRCGHSGEVEDSGIVGLLHMLPTRHDLKGLKYERDSTTARLSPIKKKRLPTSPGTQSSSMQPPPVLIPQPIVQREHFLQALQGLRQLIDCKPLPLHHPSPGQPNQGGGAVLLLPLLNDYLQHYLDILTSGEGGATPGSPSISSSSNKSSSCETGGSSLESLSSSLGVLLQQGAEYANTLETLTLCALRALNTLVCVCPDVRSLLVMPRDGAFHSHPPHPATDTSSSTAETDLEKDKPNESGVEGDDERSTTSSKGSSALQRNTSPTRPLTSPAHTLEGLDLLHKVLRLASPSQESGGFKVAVVEAALDVLSSLAVKLPSADVDRLQVIMVRGVLTECLQLEHQPGVTVRALDLFSCLVRSPALLPFLCTKPGMSDSCTSCTLMNIHVVLTRLLATCRGKQQLQPLLLSIISKVMDTVSAVVSFHRNGVYILTDNNCRCSGQIIPSLVHAMFYLLRDYQQSVNTEIFDVLRKGVLLLHEISLRDPNFQQRYGAVLPYYSTLMSGLTRIYKDRGEDLPAVEASALEDLWEELDESDTCSQDSDHEETMVTGP